MDRCIDRKMNSYIDRQTGRHMDGRKDGWMDGRMGGATSVDCRYFENNTFKSCSCFTVF